MMLYSEKIRAWLEWLEAHPEFDKALGEWEYPAVHIYLYADDTDPDADQTEKFSELCRALGAFEKKPSDGNLHAVVDRRVTGDTYGPRIFSATVTLSGACNKVPKIDEDGMPVMRDVPAFHRAATVEQVYEYRCPESWLNL